MQSKEKEKKYKKIIRAPQKLVTTTKVTMKAQSAHQERRQRKGKNNYGKIVTLNF